MNEIAFYESETGAQFIRCWQAERQTARSGRILAERLGMSPATVSVALNEESVRHAPWPLDRLDALIEVMNLSPALSDFLWLLLRRDHAPHLRQRAELTLRIGAARQYHHGRRIESDESRLLSSWYHLALFEMAHLSGLSSDAAYLSDVLVPTVGEGAIAEALELTERQGLVSRRGGALRASEDHVLSLPDDEAEAAAVRRGMRRFHQWFLRRGCEALLEFPSNERFFHADLLMVPVSAVKVLHERVGKFHAEMLLLAQQLREEAAASDEHQLQFLGIQVYPLSERVRGRRERAVRTLGGSEECRVHHDAPPEAALPQANSHAPSRRSRSQPHAVPSSRRAPPPARTSISGGRPALSSRARNLARTLFRRSTSSRPE